MNTNFHAVRSSLSMILVALSSAALSLAGCALASEDDDSSKGQDEVVGEAAQGVSFPGALTGELGTNIVNVYEPSGLARYNGLLYMASDKGDIAQYNAANNTWVTKVSTGADFESLTVAGTQLLVGVEGKFSVYDASISTVNLSNGTLPRTWTLSGVTGMEAMTFVPESYTPFGPANTTAHPGDFNGYFFVATQDNPGVISAYRLDRSSNTGTWLRNYPIGITMKTSDMSFANGVLYVLFDDGSDLLAVYTINTNPANKVLAFQKDYSLPTTKGSTKDYEAITFNQQTIYLGRDNNQGHSQDGVFEFANTIIYPQTTLPPLFW